MSDPTPAPLPPRILAGLLDTGIVLGLCLLYFLIPLLTRGLVLPMWGVLAAVLGYLVVPLAAFRKTVGMRLFGLELVTKGGHSVGAGDVLFRELIGRGFFPAAFLVTVFAGLIASWLHIAAFAFPTGLGAMFFAASAFAVGFAVLGHLLVLNRADRRSLADLMARSHVRLAQVKPLPTDAEELADFRAERARKIRNVVLFEGVLVVGALALPWLLTQRTESTGTYAARLKRQQLEARAKAEPDNEVVLTELARAWYVEGKPAEAAAVQTTIDGVRTRKQAEQLAKLKARVEADLKDERALVELLDAYEERDQLGDAKVAYRRYLDASPDFELRAGFGRWLWRRGFGEEALTEVRAAQKGDPTLEGLHSLLGRILADTDRLEEGQSELYLATLEDEEDEDAIEALHGVNEKLGALTPAKQKQLKKDFEKSRPH